MHSSHDNQHPDFGLEAVSALACPQFLTENEEKREIAEKTAGLKNTRDPVRANLALELRCSAALRFWPKFFGLY